MDFGKVGPLAAAQIDFRLHADDPRTTQTLAVSREQTRSHFALRLGTPAWGSKAWLGKVYPPGTRPEEMLAIYAKQFQSIELNATHYRMPDAATIARWVESTPPGFRFCPKVPQEISHRGTLSGNAALTKEFVHQVIGLGERLGVSFLQLGPQFSPRDLPELRSFLDALPLGFQLAVEVRHPAFFRRHTLITPLFDLLASAGAHAVILDVSGRRDVLHFSLPTPRAMVRFVGNGLHPSDEPRLHAWAERVVDWCEKGLQEIYLFVHQPDDILAPETTALLAKLLNEAFARRSLGALAAPLPVWAPLQLPEASLRADDQLKLF